MFFCCFYEVVPEQTSNTVITITPCASLQAYTPGLYHLTGNEFNVEASDVTIAVPPTKTAFTYGDYILTGTLGKKTSYSGGYVLNGDAFQYTTDNVVTNAFEAALTTDNGTPQEVKLFISEEDGINTIKNEKIKEKNDIYNLVGQRLSKMQKGVNIVNAKKVLY